MIVHFPNESLKFTWKHEPDYKLKTPTLTIVGRTFCHVSRRLSDNNGWEPLLSGLALCSSKDTYGKNTGRKVSLTDALKSPILKLTLDARQREKVWEAYFKMRGGKY